MKKEDIKKIQDSDSLAIAEKLTMRSYKEDKGTSFLGMAIQFEKSKQMEKIMESTDDTKFSETTSEYLRKVIDFGFETVYEEDFSTKHGDDKFYILWHKEYSILLCFDTFMGSRNGGNFYYNWSPNDNPLSRSLTSSGTYASLSMDLDTMIENPFPEEQPDWNSKEQTWDQFKVINNEWLKKNREYKSKNGLRDIWSGHHDCREGIKNQINLMIEGGIFLKQWINQPYLWLSHHGDKNGHNHDYKPKQEERFEKLPQYVKDCITPKK